MLLETGQRCLIQDDDFLSSRTHRRILIDTGEPDNEQYLSLLSGYLFENKIQLSHIVVTHWHADHIGGVSGVLKRMQIEKTCQVLKGKSDRDIVTSTAVADGHEIQAEGATVKLIYSPGHTDDHFAAYLVEENALFSGDCVLGEGSAVFENLRLLLSSLQTFVNLKPTVIYPGHGPVVENPMTRLQQYIDHRLMREKQVMDALPEDASAGLTIEGIVRKMYTDTPEKLMRAAAGNVFHHLNKLQEEQRVMSADNGDSVVYYKVNQLDFNSNAR